MHLANYFMLTQNTSGNNMQLEIGPEVSKAMITTYYTHMYTKSLDNF